MDWVGPEEEKVKMPEEGLGYTNMAELFVRCSTAFTKLMVLDCP